MFELYMVLSLIIIVLLIVCFVPLQYIATPRMIWMMWNIPGPKTVPILGLTFEVVMLKSHEIFTFLMEIGRKYPRMAKLWFACIPTLVVQRPEDLEVIMGSVNHITKGIETMALSLWLQEGLLLSKGKKWHLRRKLLTPTFHYKILQDNLSSINKHAKQFVKKMSNKDGESVEIGKYLNLCTLDVICETAMGVSLDMQENQGQDYVLAIKEVSLIIVKRLQKFWLCRDFIFNLSSLGKQFNKHLKILHRFTERVIYERKKYFSTKKALDEEDDANIGKKRKAFLDSLIEIDIKNPNSFTDIDIREEVDTFMFEGHDTTSVALTYACFCLGHYLDVQEKVYEEQHSIFGTSEREATMKDLQEMQYLEKVIKETLRLYPSVPYISRLLDCDAKLDEQYTIPRGCNVIIVPFVIHRNPVIFPDPLAFNPNRFNPDECSKRHPYAYIPFSAGPRNCIGQKFAMMELKTILSTIVRFFKLESITKLEELKLSPMIILKAENPIKIKIMSR